MSLPRKTLKSPPLSRFHFITQQNFQRHAHVVVSQSKNHPSDPVIRKTTASAAANTVNRLLNTFTDYSSSSSSSSSENNSDSHNTEKDSAGEVDPELSVIGSGTSSAVLVRLPATTGAKILAARGTVLGKSPGVVSRLSVEENVLAAARGRVVIYEELRCAKDVKNGTGDVLLAPKRPWDAVATLTLDGRNELQLRAGALLARSGRVVLLGTGGNTSGLNIMSRIFSYKITGRGTVAITASGGLHKVVLGNDEEYMVDSRRMVAWDAHTSTAPALSRLQPLEFKASPIKETKTDPAMSPGSNGKTNNEKTANDKTTTVRTEASSGGPSALTSFSPRVEVIREAASRCARVVWAMGSKWMRELLLGRGDYVKLTGPGVAYLAGRRGVTGLERFGVGMDWVARNMPSLPAKPSAAQLSKPSATLTLKPSDAFPSKPSETDKSPPSDSPPAVTDKPAQKPTRSSEPGSGSMSEGIAMKVVDYGSQLNNKPVLGPAINKKSKRE